MSSSSNIITVTQLNSYLAVLIDNDEVLSSLCVRGEISNFKRHSSGHLYFSIKDQNSKSSCVMFKTHACKLNFDVKDGDSVVLYGYLGVYEKTGSYQIYVNHITQSGVGHLYEQYNKLLQDLKHKGYFEQSSKKCIPLFPKKIAVITSPTGAAVRDIFSVLRRRYPISNIELYPVLVQGLGSAQSIADAVRDVNKSNDIDVIILGRGGGSIEELWSFNELIVAEAIFESNIPVISGVGHETDFTICDFVSDMRAATPSAAAELAVPDIQDIILKINNYDMKLKDSLEFKITAYEHRLEIVKEKKCFKTPIDEYDKYYLAIDNLKLNIENSMKLIMQKNVTMIEKYSQLLLSLSPVNILGRGYSYITLNGEVADTELVEVGSNIEIVSNNSIIGATVNYKKEV